MIHYIILTTISTQASSSAGIWFIAFRILMRIFLFILYVHMCTLREEIFAEFNFADFGPIREIKFREIKFAHFDPLIFP